MSGAVQDRRPSTESAPPVPPPRRYGVRQSDVWQRQSGRPATDVVHRRVLAAAADNGPSSSAAPKSCPSSPLLDGGGRQRRGDGVGQSQVVAGRRTLPSPGQNERDATTARGLASAPVTRRTKLPLSPLVRSQRDVR